MPRLFHEIVDGAGKGGPRPDLVSMLAHGEATRNMGPREYLGNILLMIIGGNDTTRNSMSGGVLFLSQNPDEFAKLRSKPELVESMVPEIIRYQTPIAYMRRTALADAEIGDQRIRKGDKVAMWYISGNRDEEAIEDPDRFIIDRDHPYEARFFRLRDTPLPWEGARRVAVENHVAGNPRTLPDNRGRWRADADLFSLRSRHYRAKRENFTVGPHGYVSLDTQSLEKSQTRRNAISGDKPLGIVIDHLFNLSRLQSLRSLYDRSAGVKVSAKFRAEC